MAKSNERAAIREIAKFVRDDTLRDLMILADRLSGARYGIGLPTNLMDSLGKHIAAIHGVVENARYELIDRAAWERYKSRIRCLENERRAFGVKNDIAYQTAFGMAVRTIFRRAEDEPRNKRQRAERARLQAEVDELYQSSTQ